MKGPLIPFFCLLIKWVEYAKFTARGSKKALLYVLSQFSSLCPSVSAFIFIFFFSWQFLFAKKERLLLKWNLGSEARANGGPQLPLGSIYQCTDMGDTKGL